MGGKRLRVLNFLRACVLRLCWLFSWWACNCRYFNGYIHIRYLLALFPWAVGKLIKKGRTNKDSGLTSASDSKSIVHEFFRLPSLRGGWGGIQAGHLSAQQPLISRQVRRQAPRILHIWHKNTKIKGIAYSTTNQCCGFGALFDP